MKSSKPPIALNIFSGKVLSVAGYIIVGLNFIALIGSAMNKNLTYTERNSLLLLFVFIGLGILLIIQGSVIKKRINRYRIYVGLISNEHITSIQGLANKISKPFNTVEKDIVWMMNRKLFVNAHIDPVTNEIIQNNPKVNNQQSDYPNIPIKYDTISCPGCGASNTKPTGTVATCEYCGSQL